MPDLAGGALSAQQERPLFERTLSRGGSSPLLDCGDFSFNRTSQHRLSQSQAYAPIIMSLLGLAVNGRFASATPGRCVAF